MTKEEFIRLYSKIKIDENILDEISKTHNISKAEILDQLNSNKEQSLSDQYDWFVKTNTFDWYLKKSKT